VRAEKLGGYVDRELERIIASAEDMVRYFRDSYAPRLEKVDVRELLAEFEARTWVDCKVSGISFTIEAPDGLAVKADRQMLLRTFLTLFRNSREAMPAGGHFSVSAMQAGEDVVFEIGDSGPGIPAGMEERIFEPFFTEQKPHAAGLGLSMALRMVDINGGTIRACARPEGGAFFTIRIPPG
jgi:signal transduction histidine kinase